MDASDIGPVPQGPRQIPPLSGRTQGAGKVPNLIGGGAQQDFDTLELLNVLRRRRRVVLGSIAIITAIAAAVVLQITPRYTAESSVVLDTRKTDVVNFQAVLSGLPADDAVVRSELEVLRSPAIAEQVVKKLQLTSVPEFNPRLQPPSMISALRNGIASLLEKLAPLLGISRTAPASDTDRAQADLVAATRALQSHVDVSNDGRSYVLKIRATSEDPKRAAALANAYADIYLQAQLEAKFDAVRRANDWLSQHLTELRKEVEASDEAVQTFKAQHHITEAKGETVTTQQIVELNSQLILAAADRAQKESSLKQVQDQLKTGGVDAAMQVLNSPLIQDLRKQEADLLQKEAQLATRYKPAHPAMINIKAQERDLEQKIKDEINKIVRSMAGEAAVARAREAGSSPLP